MIDYSRLTIAAQIASIGSGASVSIQVTNGLGREITTLTGSQYEAYLKVRRSKSDAGIIIATDLLIRRRNMQTRFYILRHWR
jgi:hypothetical protein